MIPKFPFLPSLELVPGALTHGSPSSGSSPYAHSALTLYPPAMAPYCMIPSKLCQLHPTIPAVDPWHGMSFAAPSSSSCPYPPSSSYPPSDSCPPPCPPSNSYPLSLCLGFSFSSRLIVLVEVGSSEVRLSRKVRLSEKVVPALLTIEGGF